MPGNMRLPLLFLAMISMAFYGSSVLAANPPAGQVCPPGTFVIGFDDDGNILCSETCGNGVLNEGEACDDGNTAGGDGCSASCQAEDSAIPRQDQPTEITPTLAPAVSAAPMPVKPVISKIKPKNAVFGAREVTIAISGTGFTQETTVMFKGQSYKPSVNREGTELRVTLPVRQLPIGRYAITVSNGPGKETTVKKGLEIF